MQFFGVGNHLHKAFAQMKNDLEGRRGQNHAMSKNKQTKEPLWSGERIKFTTNFKKEFTYI